MINKIVDNIEKVIIGKREEILLVINCLISGGHILIEDVPGVGKTRIVAALAKSINASFKRIQFTADVLPSDITGFSIYNQKTGDFEFKPGAVMSQFLLADEINRTSPKTQAALLEVMEERTVTVDGVTYNVPAPFMVMATQNPVEFSGTFPLPEAQLDRFFIKISIGYPSKEDELRIMGMHKTGDPFDELNAVVTTEDVLKMQQQVKQVYVAQSIAKYIVNIVDKTRSYEGIDMGASPRASINLLRAAQANAYINNRNFVIPDDVQYMAKYVLGHRVILSEKLKFDGVTSEQIVDNILAKEKAPKGDNV